MCHVFSLARGAAPEGNARHVDVKEVPSDKRPPRKVYTLNAAGRSYIAELWSNWNFELAWFEFRF